MAASRVGYTIAVPMPSSTAAAAQGTKLPLVATMPMASACSHIPPAINHFRPRRSESAPVTSCPTPHTAGYSAASTPIADTDNPPRAKNSGNSPQAMPSLRLLTIPAWLTAESARSRKLVNTNTSRVERTPVTSCDPRSCEAASCRACPRVSRTNNADSPSPSPA